MTHLLCIIFFFFMLCDFVGAQEIDLEGFDNKIIQTLRKNPFKINGGISANTIFYNSDNSTRPPFSYFLNGNLSLSIYNWTIPLSYSLNNQGSNLDYKLPYKFNRLSLHPKYKWIKTHVGDICMTFSPYTFTGLLCTGAGVELTPDLPLKVSVFGGRLNKAIADDGNARTIPSFLRTGYGAQLKWEAEKIKVGVIGFYASDKLGSLDSVPESKQVLPKENIVFSVNTMIRITKRVEVYAEIARSALTNDMRIKKWQNNDNIMCNFITNNSTTRFYSAYNAGMNLNMKFGSIGIKYENIEPEYQTLGAYYFNSDLENMTLNANLSFFKGNLTLSVNAGRQSDNLSNQKLNQTQRWVGAMNTTLKLSPKFTIVAGYSNFTSFTNNQLNQFVNLNENPLAVQQPHDSINYKQINQNANININYLISNSKNVSQMLNANYSVNDAVNKENEIIRKGGISRFHNAGINYNFNINTIKLYIATSINYTSTYVASETMNIWGPTVTLNKMLFKDKLQFSGSLSYNNSSTKSINTNIDNLRVSINFRPWKKHNFNTSLIQTIREVNNGGEKSNFNELVVTTGYNYTF